MNAFPDRISTLCVLLPQPIKIPLKPVACRGIEENSRQLFSFAGVSSSSSSTEPMGISGWKIFSITRNSTGTRKMESSVELIIPPMIAVPIEIREPAPAPDAQASGTAPMTVENAVIRIGLRRTLTVSIRAGSTARPLSTLILAYSTMRMEFLADRPISTIIPICM